MAKWSQQKYKLPKNHGWKSKAGYKIFVADRGLMRFDIPQHWELEVEDQTFTFRNKPEPDDDYKLELTIMRLVPGVDLTGLPIVHVLTESLKGGVTDLLWSGELVHVKRPDLEYAWREDHFVDSGEKREAISRSCFIVGPGAHALMTFAYWPEQAAECAIAWTEILRSLRMGEFISNPFKVAPI